MQFGWALWRIVQKVLDADPRLGPVHLSKIDIADGFYPIWIKAEDVPKLSTIFPGDEVKQPFDGLPLVLPMGWIWSPHFLTAATETVAIADLTNSYARAHRAPRTCWTPSLKRYRLPLPIGAIVTAGPAATLLSSKEIPVGRHSPPIKRWDVYIDDFLACARGIGTIGDMSRGLSSMH
jgi:hypothetical protein